ncbi:unnamed protein product [Acanthoscelides obtectus]|uniref:Uncharacterized protein n=1 Tax=Acanthoscelides obtectus TaxID=200917 RepID=A0A9P0K6A9_ACAOB|nr:unnamed protein product [Acanthoscelides obtectus]CAK1671964.1 hypothetical protein AOBTE_LOCUS28572 [Acanthoscelides obtectus]
MVRSQQFAKMESDDDLATACAIYIILAQNKKKLNKRKKRRWWSVSLFRHRDRYNGNDLLNDLSIECYGKFENFCRMVSADSEILLQLIGPCITTQTTNMRRTISAKERLAVT